jgi:hypothetical protein
MLTRYLPPGRYRQGYGTRTGLRRYTGGPEEYKFGANPYVTQCASRDVQERQRCGDGSNRAGFGSMSFRHVDEQAADDPEQRM